MGVVKIRPLRDARVFTDRNIFTDRNKGGRRIDVPQPREYPESWRENP